MSNFSEQTLCRPTKTKLDTSPHDVSGPRTVAQRRHRAQRLERTSAESLRCRASVFHTHSSTLCRFSLHLSKLNFKVARKNHVF